MTPKEIADGVVLACVVFAGIMLALKQFGLISFGKGGKAEIPDCDDSDCKAKIATLQAEYLALKEQYQALNKDMWENYTKLRDGAGLIRDDLAFIRGRLEGRLK